MSSPTQHTTDELRAALRDLAGDAPAFHPEAVHEAVSHARRRRSVATVVLAAAACLALVVAVVGGAGLLHRQRDSLAGPDRPVVGVEGHTWRLADRRVDDVEPLPGADSLPEGTRLPELTVSNGRLVIAGAVNPISGPVDVGGGRLHLPGSLSIGAVGCAAPDAGCALDDILVRLLEASPTYAIRGDHLELATGGTRAVFLLADPAPRTATAVLPTGDGTDPLGTPADLATTARYLGTTLLPAAGATGRYHLPSWVNGAVSAQLTCPARLPATAEVARVVHGRRPVSWTCPAGLPAPRLVRMPVGVGDADLAVTPADRAEGVGGARVSFYQDMVPIPLWHKPAHWTPPWEAPERGPERDVGTDVRPDPAAPNRPRTVHVRIPPGGRLVLQQNSPGTIALFVDGRMFDAGRLSPDAPPSRDGMSGLRAPQERAPMSSGFSARDLGVETQALLGQEVEVTILPWRYDVAGWRVFTTG